MTSPATLGADDLRAVMGGYRDALRLHQADINRLNVYPVPDGDTGTNMALTLESVVSELAEVEAGAGLPEVCRAISHGSLMVPGGIRGHPLPAPARMSERMTVAREAGVGPEVLIDAIGHASELARRAVVRPVEGTILTVASAAAIGAAKDPIWWVSSSAPGAKRPTRWPAPPRCCPSWPRPEWSMPAGAGTSSCSTPSSWCSTAGPCPSRQAWTPRT